LLSKALAIAIYSIILNMINNLFDFVSNNITYTAVIVSGVSLINYSFVYFWKHSSIFGNDILSPISTPNSSLFEPSTLSSGTAMQLTPTVSSSSMSNYLSPNYGTSQFQFHNYNPNWFFDLTRQLKATEA
jgi:hypothetical protein